jgi:hypothetical protein
MSETRVEVRLLRLVLAVTVLAPLAVTALGGQFPGPGPTIPAPVSKPGVPGTSLPPTIEFALADGTRPCMEMSAVSALRYRVSVAAGGIGIRFVEIKPVLSDGSAVDSLYMQPMSPPLPAVKEERRIPFGPARPDGTSEKLVGFKLETMVNGALFSRQIPFHYFPAMSLKPEKAVIETIVATNGRGGATVNYELVAQLVGIGAVSVRGEPALPSADTRSVTTSEATIVPGSPARLRWTIHWADGTEAIWRGARTHRLTARQWGTCGDRTLSVGPIAGLRR